MTIVVRTKYPEIFNIFYSTFTTYYGDLDLIVHVDLCDGTEEEFEDRVQKFVKLRDWYSEKYNGKGFDIKLISRQTMDKRLKVHGNFYSNQLFKSVQYDDDIVVSFDDDIVWMKDGFFDMIKRTIPKGNVFGQRMLNRDDTKIALASYCFGTRGVKLTMDDFTLDSDMKDLQSYYGNDAYKVYLNHKDNTTFICNPVSKGTNWNAVFTEYYYHIGGLGFNLERAGI